MSRENLSGRTEGGSHKVIIIGLDGATWDLVRPMLDQGIMPNLKKLVDSGSHGQLSSTVPPVTAPAWSSFFTGKNPGKHNLYDFWGPLRKGFSRRLNDSRSIKAQALWDILGQHGKTVGMLNVPMTYPIADVNGYAIAGMLSARFDETFARPAEMLDVLNDGRQYTLDVEPATYIERGAITELLNDLISMTKQRIDLAETLINRQPVDLFMMVFVTPDRIQHTLWHILDPSHPLHDEKEARKYLPLIHDCFSTVDEGIGRIVKAAGPSSATVIMSDHGFGALNCHVDIEAWLRKTGYLSYRTGLRNIRRILEVAHAETLVWKTLGVFRKGKKAPLGLAHIKEFMIDWERSSAYRGDAAGYSLYLNVRGREPFGAVEPGAEYEAVREAMISALTSMRDPKTGALVVTEVRKGEDVYWGPNTGEAPDILVKFKDGYKAGRPYYSSKVFWPARRDRWGTGSHREEGIVALSGPDIKAEASPLRATIMDIAPTVLYLLGLPIPSDMDGRVIDEAIDDGLWAARHPEYSEGSPGVEGGTSAAGGIYSADDEEIMNERLRNLGYVE